MNLVDDATRWRAGDVNPLIDCVHCDNGRCHVAGFVIIRRLQSACSRIRQNSEVVARMSEF